jgi:hypothetical protein
MSLANAHGWADRRWIRLGADDGFASETSVRDSRYEIFSIGGASARLGRHRGRGSGFAFSRFVQETAGQIIKESA